MGIAGQIRRPDFKPCRFSATLVEKEAPMAFTWSLGVNEDVITEYGQATLHEFLSDPQVVVDTSIRANQKMKALVGQDLIFPHPTSHAFLESEALGATIHWPTDSWPAPKEPLIKGTEDIEKLSLIRDFMSRPNTAILRDMRRHLSMRCGAAAGGLHEGMVGNAHITTARALRGDQIFIDLYERPQWCHRLFGLLVQNHILCTQDLWKYQGIQQARFFHIADDFAGMVSADLFKEFVVPYWHQTLSVLGAGCETVMLHSEMMHPEHLPLLADLPITVIDYGQDPFVTPQDALATGFDTSWHFKDLELLIGTPESIRTLYGSYAESGLSSIKLALVHRRIPSDNILALLQVAREYE